MTVDWTKIAVLGVAFVVAVFLLRSYARDGLLNRYTLALMLYCFAVMAIAMGFFPNYEQSPSAETGDALPIYLFMAGGCLVIGGLLSWSAHRRYPHTVDRRLRKTMWFLMGGSVVYVLVLHYASEPGGVTAHDIENWGGWVLGAAAAGAALLLCLLLGGLLLYAKYIHVGGRMARMLAADDIAGAIRLGESLDPAKRDLAANFNLATAYERAGRYEDARQLIVLIDLPPESNPGLKRVVDELKSRLDDATLKADNENASHDGAIP